jgi:hypothetical protein
VSERPAGAEGSDVAAGTHRFDGVRPATGSTRSVPHRSVGDRCDALLVLSFGGPEGPDEVVRDRDTEAADRVDC